MKFLIQRVSKASVHIHDTDETNSIGQGLLIYVGIHRDDVDTDRKELVNKFVRRVDKLELFSQPSPPAPLPKGEGSNSKSRKSMWLRDIDGELLVISNFTLYGRNKKAGSVDFTHSAKYDVAEPIYDYLIDELRNKWLAVQTGKFGAMMEVSSTLMGPVNVVLEW